MIRFGLFLSIGTSIFIVLAYFLSRHLVVRVLISEADKVIHLPDQPEVDFQQFAGYITVDEINQRNLFYYFVESEVDPVSKPVVLWLNGGPGCSSIGQGAFTEHGPFQPTRKGGLVKNQYSWNRAANMLYLDSPASVGFSYSTNKSFYDLLNDELTARDNLVFLRGWFTKFPQYKDNDFFITGEDYAGHFAPQLAHLILQGKTKINLKGIAVSTNINLVIYIYIVYISKEFHWLPYLYLQIGNPHLEFNTDTNSKTDFLWAHGLISDKTYGMLLKLCNYSQISREYRNLTTESNICRKVAIQVAKEIGAVVDYSYIRDDICSQTKQQLQGEQKRDACVERETHTYLNRKDVHKALHAVLVGINKWSSCSGFLTYDVQNLDIPTISLLGSLVRSGVRVMVYSGDQDSVVPFMGTRSLVNRLAEEIGFKTSQPYRTWFVGKRVAGWNQVYGDILTFATVRGAGGAAPATQPESSLVLFKAFLEGKPLPNNH
ncbi:serine carboxypeptidase-like 45 isoform X2 [Trifolium pratense]|nr:serine carboxypeptidase-like 45 isoform X2 [Trifolium pratense]XP_045787390.1 serine carboxypeptidase-like 45 isoform X2 [Trifolium pratense]XP_045787391.1 serine carboxypeptidase-like 45 isoform X2 [Trifolium pratense]XP_045787392.1 serine carboxypeptidase-like 45 isoform X2 [Trifolium pratense]XP_045787393.1 serine carboxypeptidase-like 45 isoform X2 [Trifolium pratense]XP_045787394.1 serine carboxypeptidase-like 45 isoform X2 [Trifolium pratense]